jgi:hypothetical protein
MAVETGFHEGPLIAFNYDTEPLPATGRDIPGIGAAMAAAGMRTGASSAGGNGAR